MSDAVFIHKTALDIPYARQSGPVHKIQNWRLIALLCKDGLGDQSCTTVNSLRS